MGKLFKLFLKFNEEYIVKLKKFLIKFEIGLPCEEKCKQNPNSTHNL